MSTLFGIVPLGQTAAEHRHGDCVCIDFPVVRHPVAPRCSQVVGRGFAVGHPVQCGRRCCHLPRQCGTTRDVGVTYDPSLTPMGIPDAPPGLLNQPLRVDRIFHAASKPAAKGQRMDGARHTSDSPSAHRDRRVGAVGDPVRATIRGLRVAGVSGDARDVA